MPSPGSPRVKPSILKIEVHPLAKRRLSASSGRYGWKYLADVNSDTQERYYTSLLSKDFPSYGFCNSQQQGKHFVLIYIFCYGFPESSATSRSFTIVKLHAFESKLVSASESVFRGMIRYIQKEIHIV